jgi:hypothetical protein
MANCAPALKLDVQFALNRVVLSGVQTNIPSANDWIA